MESAHKEVVLCGGGGLESTPSALTLTLVFLELGGGAKASCFFFLFYFASKSVQSELS